MNNVCKEFLFSYKPRNCFFIDLLITFFLLFFDILFKEMDYIIFNYLNKKFLRSAVCLNNKFIELLFFTFTIFAAKKLIFYINLYKHQRSIEKKSDFRFSCVKV